jgi:hypothetical protein
VPAPANPTCTKGANMAPGLLRPVAGFIPTLLGVPQAYVARQLKVQEV